MQNAGQVCLPKYSSMVTRREFEKSLEQRVLGFIRAHHQVSPHAPLVVAVSGGADSVCLLHVLNRLRGELQAELHVAHLDHRLRGAESRGDAVYVAGMARRLGITATIEECDVRAYHAERDVTLEEAAREVRYAFLAKVAVSINADRVAVGHTTDDHAETVLMHIIRGTGTTGLRGLQPVAGWRASTDGITVVRPLLEVTRKDTLEYCRQCRMRPRVDVSNFSLSPLRNRLRHHLLPLLQEYNPQIVKALVRTARIAGDDLGVLDRETARLWEAVVRRQADTVIIDGAGFLELPSGLQRNLLRRAMEELLGSPMDIEARHIEEMLAALTLPAGRRLSLPGGLFFTVEYDRYLLGADPSALCPYPGPCGEFVLKVPGVTITPGWRVETVMSGPGQVVGEEDGFTAHLDADRIGQRILVRTRRPGDRFRPLGMSETKKLGEFMIDARVPRAWRPRVPVVCSGDDILWVVGWRIDDRARVTENTREVLRVRFERVPDSVGEQSVVT